MVKLESDITLSTKTFSTLLGTNLNKEPWNCFVEIVKGERETEENENLLNEATKMFELISGEKIIKNKIRKKHENLSFMIGNIDGIYQKNNENIGVFFTYPDRASLDDIRDKGKLQVDDYNKFNIRMCMSIFGLKNSLLCEYVKTPNGTRLRTSEVKNNNVWFESIVRRCYRYKKEIDYYKTFGIEKHPIEKFIKQWNSGEQIILDSPPEEKVVEEAVAPIDAPIGVKEQKVNEQKVKEQKVNEQKVKEQKVKEQKVKEPFFQIKQEQKKITPSITILDKNTNTKNLLII